MNRVMPRIHSGLLALCSLMIASVAYASAPSITIDVDQRALTPEQHLTLWVKVVGEHQEIQAPELTHFKVIDRVVQTHRELTGAESLPVKEITYTLQATQIGQHALGPFTLVTSEDEHTSSEQLTVSVHEHKATKALSVSEARDRAIVPGEAAVVQVHLPKDSYYVGEPFPITWNIYWRSGPQLDDATVTRAPEMEGLETTGLMSSSAPMIIDELDAGDLTFLHAPRAQKLAVATEPGKVRVEPLSIAATMDGRRYIVRSPAVEVPIRALPNTEAPAGFAPGNVGQFGMTSRLLNAQGAVPTGTRVGEALFMEIEVSGNGNFDSLGAPKIEASEVWEVRAVEPASPGLVARSAAGIQGNRRYRYALTPKQAGLHATPSAHLAYFDPNSGSYQGLSTGGRELRLAPASVQLAGGQTLGTDGLHGARAEIGWPEAKFTYILPLMENLDISPQFALRYGHNLDAGLIGFEPGAEIRWHVWQGYGFSLALVSEPALMMWVPTTSESAHVGLRLGLPGAVLGYQLTTRVALNLGMRAPLSVVFQEGTRVLWPLLFDAGVEVLSLQTEELTWAMTGRATIGSEFCLSECAGDTSALTLSVLIGSSFVW